MEYLQYYYVFYYTLFVYNSVVAVLEEQLSPPFEQDEEQLNNLKTKNQLNKVKLLKVT